MSCALPGTGSAANEWVRCPILIGREGPVSLIAGAVRRLRVNVGGALVVVGEAGVGKTRLAEYLSDAAARAGIEAVHGRAPAELFLREAGRDAEGSEDLRAEIACQLAQVLLHAGQLSEAAQIASRMVTVTDGCDLAAATAMRLVLARAAVMTAAWDNARIKLADVRRSRPADQEAHAEAAVIEAQVALGDGRPVPAGRVPRGCSSGYRPGRRQARSGL